MSITFQFTWPKQAGFEALELSMATDQLKARDPEGKSLIAGKLRMCNLSSKDPVEFSALGPRENQMMSPTLVRFVWDHAKSGSLVCPWALSPKECSLALDYFGFEAHDDIIIADDDPLKTCKLFTYSAFKNTNKAVPGVIHYVKSELSSNKLASGMHFIVAPRTPMYMYDGFDQDTMMHHYRLGHLPAGYTATTLKVLPLPGEKGAEHPCTSFEALSPDTENAWDARNAVLAGVKLVGGGGFHVRWSKRLLNLADVGEHGMRKFTTAWCHVLEVEVVGNDGFVEAQGILSIVAAGESEDEDGHHVASSKRTRNDDVKGGAKGGAKGGKKKK